MPQKLFVTSYAPQKDMFKIQETPDFCCRNGHHDNQHGTNSNSRCASFTKKKKKES